MIKQKFVELYKNNMSLSNRKEAEKLINGVFSTIEEILKNGETISFTGFGKFETKLQHARTFRNPKTGEEIQMEEKKIVKFKVGKNLASKIAKK